MKTTRKYLNRGVGGHRVFTSQNNLFVMISFASHFSTGVGGHKVFEMISFPSHSSGGVGGHKVFEMPYRQMLWAKNK
jgi:hypothetical protein